MKDKAAMERALRSEATALRDEMTRGQLGAEREALKLWRAWLDCNCDWITCSHFEKAKNATSDSTPVYARPWRVHDAYRRRSEYLVYTVIAVSREGYAALEAITREGERETLVVGLEERINGWERTTPVDKE